ncbi:MAG: cupin domain-containing protein [Synergistaceae bacterium]|nr:cupin domain-containing protein [Synergistaceae bacterium]
MKHSPLSFFAHATFLCSEYRIILSSTNTQRRLIALKEKGGVVFSLAQENSPVEGCTISRSVCEAENFGMTYFSMAHDTDISPEIFPDRKIILNASGQLIMNLLGHELALNEGECAIVPANTPAGMTTSTGCVYVELALREGVNVNKALKEGEVFSLGGLVPYQSGRVVNMDIIKAPNLKFAVMAFDEGTGLSEHSAPGEALIFALDGEGIIGYEGQEYHIKAGENFKFAKNGRHYVKAHGKFKMAILLTLEADTE